MSDARDAPKSGDALDERTTLTSPIGRGGMGSVWLARFSTLETEVVVKLIAPELTASPTMRERLLREARAAARVQSTHAVKVYDARTSERFGPFLVMERLDGESLQDRLERTTSLSFANASRVVAEVAHALDDAHRQGVIHRDIKPGNIFLSRTATAPFVVKVLDFGIARIENETMTDTGHVIGTPAFMSPEQVEGRALDGRSDLYALALVFFRCVTGVNAIAVASVRALGIGAYRLPLPSPRDHVPDLPPAVDAWFARATSFLPEDRFASGREMALALEEAAGSAATLDAEPALAAEPERTVGAPDELAPPPAPLALTPRPPRMRRWVGGVAALAIAAGLGFVGLRMYAQSERAGSADAPLATSAPDAGAAAEIRIGVVLDLGSAHRERGRAMQKGIAAAEMLFERHGGVRKRHLRFSFVDDHGATDAEPLRGSLAAARVLPLVIGPTTSDQLVATLPWLAETRTLAISPSATLVKDASPFLLRTAPSDAQAAVALAAFVARDEHRCAAIAVVRTSDVYGASYERELTSALGARGRAVVTVPPVSPFPQKSYGETLDAVARTGAPCEVLVLPAPVGARYLLEGATRVRKARTFASDSLANEDFIALARGARDDVGVRSAAEGAMGVRARRAAPGRTERRFFERLLAEADAGRAADDTFAANAFDAAMLAGLALEKVGTEADAPTYRAAVLALSREGATYGPQDLDELVLAIRQNRNVDYQGASGDVDMNDDGDVRADFSPWAVVDGRIVDR